MQNKQADCEIKKISLKWQEWTHSWWLYLSSWNRTNVWKERNKSKEYSFVSVAHINNEAQLYDVVNVTGLVCNINPI